MKRGAGEANRDEGKEVVEVVVVVESEEEERKGLA